MRRLAILFLSAGLSLAAAPALACADGRHHAERERYESRDSYGYAQERYEGGGYDEQRYEDERYDDRSYDDQNDDRAYDDRAYDDGPPAAAGPWYNDGRHPARECDCPPGGGVQLSNSFFYDAGGVGPIPDGGWYGGAYVVGGGYGQSSARSYASTSSSASVSIRGGAYYGGGYSRGGHGKGGYGGKGGHGGKGH